MKRNVALLLLCFAVLNAYAQTDLERHFNLCLAFGAPLEVVELYQAFRVHLEENNGAVSYIAQEDTFLLKDKPYTEYQIWYTVDDVLGLYQSTLIVRGTRQVLQNTFTAYFTKFYDLYGEPVYSHLDNGSLLVFWYSEETFTVRARLILDIVNAYRYISITHCSAMPMHINLLRILYNGTIDEYPPSAAEVITPPFIPPNQPAAEPLPEDEADSDIDL